MADFLLELRCEEIPARMQAGARAELEKLFRKFLKEDDVEIADLVIWSTPRRLSLIARDLPSETKASAVEFKGPRVGAPDQAIDGFLRRHGVPRDELVDRNGVYFLTRLAAGRPMSRVLQDAIPKIIEAFAWPKSMRWGAASISTDSLRWVRPLLGIVALLDGDVVSFEIDGIEAGRETYGHRFHAVGPITIDGADDYADKLRAAHVIVDHEERAAIIREGATRAAAEAGLTLVADEGLVIENAGLTEWPVPLLGRFDEAFLDVPPEVIQLTARVNQKYFVCEDAQGKLANAFVCTANIDPRDAAVVVDGNRKVLAARLSDARFFWEQDQKTPLAEHAKKLSRITFHEKLGTVADKVERVAKLARWLCEENIVVPAKAGTALAQSANSKTIPASAGMTKEELADLAEQAARLCKADLVTEMVGEFPELQGLMGGYYAAKEGLPQEVAEAIRDHYKPVGQGDDVPTAPVTVAVSLADKLDTLVGFFAIDEKPTGSKDPFALRRAALGVLLLLMKNGLRLPLGSAFPMAMLTLVYSLSDRETYRPVLFFPSRNHEHAKLGIQEQHSGDDAIEAWKRDEGQLSIFHEKGRFTDYDGVHHIEPDPGSCHLQKPTTIVSGLHNFLADRLKVQQREAGVHHDLIDAVFALGGEDDLVRLLARVHALQAFVTTEDGANLLAGYKRAANILKKEDWRGIEGEIAHTGEEDPLAGVDDPDLAPVIAAKMADRHAAASTLSYTPEPAEKALIDALDAAAPRAAEAVETERFADAMAALATLRAPIDRFFEEVTVNAEEANKRAARLDLLARFRDAVHRVADFSRIEG